MRIFAERKKYYFGILIYSIFVIFFALYIEYVLNYKACELCIYQRLPYIIAIFISFLGLNYYKNDRLLILNIITFLISTIISGYHFGIENNIFPEFSGCTNDTLNLTQKSEIIKSLENMPASCKDANFKIFGLSLSGLNFLSSLIISILSIKILAYEKK
tara:strand:+ start:536 stop:1012 length:477 start_codon:yes stop_codon:yes gene_type:complete